MKKLAVLLAAVCLLLGCADSVITSLRGKRKPIDRDERIST